MGEENDLRVQKQIVITKETVRSFMFANPEDYDFESTKDLKPHAGLEQVIGQDIAKREVLRNFRTRLPAYHCMTQGPPGVGKSFNAKVTSNYLNDLIIKLRADPGYADLELARLKCVRPCEESPSNDEIALKVAKTYAKQMLYDQVALFNFRKSTRPNAFVLPKGYGLELDEDMTNMIELMKGTGSEISFDSPDGEIDDRMDPVLESILKTYKRRASYLDFKKYHFDIQYDLLDDVHLSPSLSVVVPEYDQEEVRFREEEYQRIKNDLVDTISRGMTKVTTEINAALKSGKVTGSIKSLSDGSANPELKKFALEIQNKYIFSPVARAQEFINLLSFDQYLWSIDCSNLPEVHGHSPYDIERDDPDVEAKLTDLDDLIELLREDITNKTNYKARKDHKIDETKIPWLKSFDALKKKWRYTKKLVGSQGYDISGIDKLLEWFDLARKDVLTRDFEGSAQMQGLVPLYDIYSVNILVDNSKTKGIPIVVVENPGHQNLFGTAGHDAVNRTPEHLRLKAGAFMEANGGILIIDEGISALRHPEQRDYFLTVLQDQTLRVGGGRGLAGGGTSANIESDPFDAVFKLIMNSNQNMLEVLEESPQIADRFGKVLFEPDMENTEDNRRKIATFCSDVINRYNKGVSNKVEYLPHLSKELVAYLVNKACSRTGDPKKLTNELRSFEQRIIRMAIMADERGDDVVNLKHAKQYQDEKKQSTGGREKRGLERIVTDGLLSLDPHEVGSINGLVYLHLAIGDDFGLPENIEATVAKGKGRMQLIEAKAELAGHTMKKGFAIGETYLKEKYGSCVDSGIKNVGNLDATISFPVSVSEMDGNSASGAGILALLSALSGYEIDQRIAVTGAIVGHNGRIGPIGGVYEKTRGFYNFAKAKGVDGCGVMIPRQNEEELLLRVTSDPEMLADIMDGKFNLYTWTSIDDGIEVMMGKSASDVHSAVFANLPKYL